MSYRSCRPISGTGRHMLWVDLEMTGLDLGKDLIMQVGVLLTDNNLKILYEKEWDIHVPDGDLDNMGEWCRQHHGESGLTERCRKSTVHIEDVEEEVCMMLDRIVPDKYL
ncbi:Oligoribonuclease like protein, partial [Aduncisulcus paluster]